MLPERIAHAPGAHMPALSGAHLAVLSGAHRPSAPGALPGVTPARLRGPQEISGYVPGPSSMRRRLLLLRPQGLASW